jgi:hypothetical protein
MEKRDMATVSFVKAPSSGITYATVAGYAACGRIERAQAGIWHVKWNASKDFGLFDGQAYTFRTLREAKAHIQARFDLWESNRAASGAMLGR